MFDFPAFPSINLGSLIGGIPLSVWLDVWANSSDITNLGRLSQVCSLFNKLIKGYCIRFPDFSKEKIVEYKLPPNISLGTKDITFIANIKPTQKKYGMIFAKDQSHDPNDQFRIEINSDLKLAAVCFSIPGTMWGSTVDPNGYTSELHTPRAVPLNEFTRIAFVRRGRDIIIFVNNERVAEYKNRSVHNSNSLRPYRVGSRFAPGIPKNFKYENCKSDNFFPGEITGARMWFRALSDSEIVGLSK